MSRNSCIVSQGRNPVSEFWFLSSPVRAAPRRECWYGHCQLSLTPPCCCFCGGGGPLLIECPCFGDVYSFSLFLSIMLALERLRVCEAVKGMVLGEGGRWISRTAFQIAHIPWEMLPRKMLVWTACSLLRKSVIWVIAYWFPRLILTGQSYFPIFKF